jgi:hypothetical protein
MALTQARDIGFKAGRDYESHSTKTVQPGAWHVRVPQQGRLRERALREDTVGSTGPLRATVRGDLMGAAFLAVNVAVVVLIAFLLGFSVGRHAR